MKVEYVVHYCDDTAEVLSVEKPRGVHPESPRALHHASIYEDNGYASREYYLECLSEDYNVPLDTVEALANLYGEVEMFDGLVTALQDIEGVCE